MPETPLDRAHRKRQLAERIRRMAPGLAREGDRANILEHAEGLEAEAAALEALAASPRPKSRFFPLIIGGAVIAATLLVIQLTAVIVERTSVRDHIVADDRIEPPPLPLPNVNKPAFARTAFRLPPR